MPRKKGLFEFTDGMRLALERLGSGGTGEDIHRHIIKSLIARGLAASYLSEDVDNEGSAIMHYKITRRGKAKLAE